MNYTVFYGTIGTITLVNMLVLYKIIRSYNKLDRFSDEACLIMKNVDSLVKKIDEKESNF